MAVPMSQGFGMAKHPEACNSRKARRLSVVLGEPIVLSTPDPFGEVYGDEAGTAALCCREFERISPVLADRRRLAGGSCRTAAFERAFRELDRAAPGTCGYGIAAPHLGHPVGIRPHDGPLRRSTRCASAPPCRRSEIRCGARDPRGLRIQCRAQRRGRGIGRWSALCRRPIRATLLRRG